MTGFEQLHHNQQLTHLKHLAGEATRLYPLPQPLTVTLVNLSENATFKVEAPDGRRWALRIHRQGYHTRAAIASELAWAADLRATGLVTTPHPIKGLDGEVIQSLGHASTIGPRHIVVFAWEAGVEPGITDDLGTAFEALGEVTARMHQHSRQWQRPPWFTRFTWDFDTSLGETAPHWGRWRDGIGVDAEKKMLFGRTVTAIGKRLAAYGKGPGRFGLIHGDLRLANLLIDGPRVKVIDFDDCGFGWHMYDAATPVSFYEHEPQVPALIDSWKKGYRRAAELTRDDEAEIPTFIMLRRLLLVAWIGSRHETDLAKSKGITYTNGTAGLCEDYLSQFG
jgi:Ser/Thr protein kinase RdoA (MazF antagonist)